MGHDHSHPHHDHSHCDHTHGSGSYVTLEDHCHTPGRDYLYMVSLAVVGVAYALHLAGLNFESTVLADFNHRIFNLINEMWWGIALSIFAVGVMSKIPREMVMTYFGAKTRLGGLFKATMAGTLFDLCNHGIILLAMKVYERGASLGQTLAFLIASPWNSFSLTMILYSLIGGELTFLYLILSLVIAVITGWLFDEFVDRGWIPKNPHQYQPAQMQPLRIRWDFRPATLGRLLKTGFYESQVILKWIFVGAILSALLGVFLSPDIFMKYFGNSLQGLLATLLAATGIEVCSEGSVPLAADLVTVAKAPGNAFIFLMAGVATDLTEILAVRATTRSWKIAALLPATTVPQIIFWGWFLNNYAQDLSKWL